MSLEGREVSNKNKGQEENGKNKAQLFRARGVVCFNLS